MAKSQLTLPANSSSTSEFSSKLAQERYIWVVFGVGLVGFALRLMGLGSRPLWFDEIISAVYARQDFNGLVALNSGDNHPVGYYLTLKGWMALFGNSETAIRLLSVVPGVAAMALVWLIGRRLFPSAPLVALAALALAALSPFQIYFSQEARNYSFMEFFVLAAVWCWLRALEDNRWRNWIGLGMCGAVGMVYNLTTAFYLAALGLWVLFQARRYWQNGVLLRLCATGIGAGLLSGIVLMPKLLSRLDVIQGNFWIPQPNPIVVLYTFYAFVFGAVAMERFVPAFGLGLILFLLTFGAVIPAGYRALKQRAGGDNALLKTVWLLFGPILLVIIVSLLFQPLYLDKALIGCAPFYYLLIAWAIFRPDSPKKIVAGRQIIAALPISAAILLALISLPSLYDGTIAPRYIARYDASRINDYLRQNSQPGDVVTTASDISWLPLYYYDTTNTPPKYPLKEYPYQNIFPLLLEKLHTQYGVEDEFARRFGAKRLWVVFEVNAPENSLKDPPHPADLSGEVAWLHSPDWQGQLLAHYDRQYQRLQAIALDRVILVLYQL